MQKTMTQIWSDDNGFIVSIELILIATIAVLGLITGMVAVRDAVVSELSDVGGAVQDLNQSYTYNAIEQEGGLHSDAGTAGSSWTDLTDHCDTAEDVSGAADNCILFTTGPSDEG